MLTPSASGPDRYQQRDLLILKFTAAYGVVLNAAVSRLFFHGKQAGHVIRRLADEGYLQLFPRTLPGGVTYGGLTRTGCARIGVSEKLSRPWSGYALNQALALVCYCTLGPFRRHRLKHADLKGLLADRAPPPNAPHVLLPEAELGRHAMLRVHFAAGTVHETKKQLRRRIDEAERNPALTASLGPDGSYGFLLLAPTETGKRSLDQAIQRSGLRNSSLIVVEASPGAEELAAFLRRAKGAVS